MKKNSNLSKSKRSLLYLFVILTFTIGFVFISRAYFLAKPSESSIYQNVKKYNDPLELKDIPKLNSTTEVDIFPTSEFEYSDSENIWVSVKTESEIQIGYFDNNLSFTQRYFLPTYIQDIKIYEDEKIFFILEAKEGDGPSLVFKDKKNTVEILQLNPSEYFTGYFYSPSEKTFYISKANGNGINTLFSLRNDGETQSLLELSDKFEILKANETNAILKKATQCLSFAFATKQFSEISCNSIYLNSENINLIHSPSMLIIIQNGEFKDIYTAKPEEVLGNEIYFNKNLYFVVYKLNGSSVGESTKILRSSLSGEVDTLTQIFPEGEIDKAFFINEIVIINKYFGLERLMKLLPESALSFPVSYPQDRWSEIKFLQEKILDIEFLMPDYQID